MPTNAPGYLTRRYKRSRRRIVQQLGGRCAECFEAENLEIHHRQDCHAGTGRGREERVKGWKKCMVKNGLVLLCRKCHTASHWGGK